MADDQTGRADKRADDGVQLDLFVGDRGHSNVLDRELWRRRQDRREAVLIASMDDADSMLVPLALALARLAAQRDAKFLAAAAARH